MSPTRSVLVCTALLTLTFGASGCGPQDDRAPSAPAAARSEIAATGLQLRIKPGGQYFVAGDPDALTAEQLSKRLRRENPAQFRRSVYILSDPGVVGYDVILAVNAAQDAGFTRAEGLANYREGASTGPDPSPWEMDLSRPLHRPGADTARR